MALDDAGHCINVYETPMPKLPPTPRSTNAMERIAQEVARGEAEDELADSLLEIVGEVEEGLYKHVEVNMRGVSGNALVIIGTVKQALQQAGAPKEHVACFVGFAMCDDYENVLKTCSKWVTITDKAPTTGDAFSAFAQHSEEEEAE